MKPPGRVRGVDLYNSGIGHDVPLWMMWVVGMDSEYIVCYHTTELDCANIRFAMGNLSDIKLRTYWRTMEGTMYSALLGVL
jgi:hypothetical protein